MLFLMFLKGYMYIHSKEANRRPLECYTSKNKLDQRRHKLDANCSYQQLAPMLCCTLSTTVGNNHSSRSTKINKLVSIIKNCRLLFQQDCTNNIEQLLIEQYIDQHGQFEKCCLTRMKYFSGINALLAELQVRSVGVCG